MFSEYDDIKDITGTDENICACKECVAFCHASPCMGTPTDILEIIKSGHTGHIVSTVWTAGRAQGIPPINMLQPYFDGERQCCTFMDDAKKKCTLHDLGLKPTEGKLFNHALGALGVKMGINLPIAHAVALTWVEDRNMPVVMEILNEIREQKSKTSKPQTDEPS